MLVFVFLLPQVSFDNGLINKSFPAWIASMKVFISLPTFLLYKYSLGSFINDVKTKIVIYRSTWPICSYNSKHFLPQIKYDIIYKRPLYSLAFFSAFIEAFRLPSHVQTNKLGEIARQIKFINKWCSLV